MILFGLEIILFFAAGSVFYDMYNTNKFTNNITNNGIPSYNSISPPPAIPPPYSLPPPSYYQ